jgi:5-aminopentanamidase
MKVAAYQAPLACLGDVRTAVSLVRQQVENCEALGVQILCCPEGTLGGLADYVDDPRAIAIDVKGGQLSELLKPLSNRTVAIIIGFTEIDQESERLYNSAAVWLDGSIVGVYRKVYPAINRSVYDHGEELPVFTVAGLAFGIVICNDSNYLEPARVMAHKGAAAIFIPTNNGLPASKGGPALVRVARAIDIARAVENSVAVVRADVVGCMGELECHGSSGIVDPDGNVLQEAAVMEEALVVAEIDIAPRAKRRGWDSHRNSSVVSQYLRTLHSTESFESDAKTATEACGQTRNVTKK